MKYIFTFLFIISLSVGYSQDKPVRVPKEVTPNTKSPNTSFEGANQNAKTIKDKKEKPLISEYKIISSENDTTYVDTILNIHKDYKWNYLRKDDFELLAFANVGQPYNELGYTFNNVFIDPKLGARTKHVNHYEIEDVYYYNVPTPHTELFYKTVLQQGQTLEALFTSNTSPNFNFFVSYKGLRSLGKYQSSLSSTGNLKLGFTYTTNNKRYILKTHFAAQDYTNQEQGGLTTEATQQFIDEVEEFEDRSLLEVNFLDAESTLDSRRFYLDHNYYIIKKPDSITSNTLSVGHKLTFIDKEYGYTQATPFSGYGDSFESNNLNDLTEFQNVTNTGQLTYSTLNIGTFVAKASHTNYNYGYNRTVNINSGFITNRLTGSILKVGGAYNNTFGKLKIYLDVMSSISGDQNGNYIDLNANYQVSKDIDINLNLSSNEHASSYNTRLYQSDYINYNWENDFLNESYQNISVKLKSKKYGTLSVSNTIIDNYVYFAHNADTLVKPFQSLNTVSYFKANFQNTLKFGLFGLTNTVQYQNVSSGKEVFNVPNIITRHSIYYEDYWFKKALYLQTGFTGKYFSKYNANAYDPVLSEFYVQNITEIGGYPILDFFFNAKIKQTRIFFKLENTINLFDKNSNFSAPNYPYRDFVIRFGLVWDFFL